MVDENRFEGAARDFGGKVQETVGDIMDDPDTQARGKVNQVFGQAQNTFGAAADEVRETVTAQPLTALLIVGAIGLALGFLAAR